MISRVFTGLALYLTLFAATALCAPDEWLVAGAISIRAPLMAALGDYVETNPEVRLTYNFAASGVLLRQMEAGAPVDLVLFADESTMEEASEEKLVEVSSVAVVATNRVVLAVSATRGGLGEVEQFLRDPGLSHLAVGNPDYVPLGRYVKTALVKTGEWERLGEKLVLTSSAEQTLAYLASGEVDAAFLYRTDAERLEPGKFRVFGAESIQKARYYVAVASRSAGNPGVRALRDYLLSAKGQARFVESGFGPR